MGRKSKEQLAQENQVATETPGPFDKVEEVVKEQISETPPVQEKKSKEETVEIKKTDYDRLMAQLERNAKDIDLLYKASDKSRMAKAMNESGEILIKQARVWTWANTGKIVISTKLLTNRSEITQGKWIEDQQVQIVLDDGEILTAPYLEFSRNILNKIPADIISRSESYDALNNKVTLFKLQLPNGKTLEINSAFVN